MVLVNELGEVGIDHHLVEHASESTLLLENGCLCCAMRDDLKTALKELHSRRARGEIPSLRARRGGKRRGSPTRCPSPTRCWPSPCSSITIGWATSSPSSTRSTPRCSSTGSRSRSSRWRLADRLVVSKLDIAGPGAFAALRPRLAKVNPDAPIITAEVPDLDPVELLIADIHDRQSKSREVERWMRSTAGPRGGARRPPPAYGGHHRLLLHLRCRPRLDRVRSVDVDAAALPRRPRAANQGAAERGRRSRPGAGETGSSISFTRPRIWNRWPDEDRRSRLVVISSGLDREEIERSLHAFNALANPAPEPVGRELRSAAPPLRERAQSYAGAGARAGTPSSSARPDSG